VALLIRHFTTTIAKKIGRSAALPPGIEEALARYDWPGNIRELQNVVERAVILSGGPLGGEHLEIEDLLGPSASRPSAPAPSEQETSPTLPAGASMRLEDVERDHLKRVLEQTGGRIEGSGAAAEVLDLNPSTLRSRLRKWGIERP